MNRKLLTTAALAAIAFACPALAEPIVLSEANEGQSFTFNFNGGADGTIVSGLTASTTLTLIDATATSYLFNYSVKNTTDGSVDLRVSSFGFNTSPALAGASATGTYHFVNTGGNVPNGIGKVGVCFKAGGSNSCSGPGGVLDDQTGMGTLTLHFSDPISSLTLDDFFVRYQSISGAGRITSATGTVTSTSTSGSTSTGGNDVPEPSVIGLLGASLIGLYFLRRRRPHALELRHLSYA